MLALELAALFRRELTRLVQEISEFPDESALWGTVEGVSNSAGNLALHLEGNLHEYIGRQLGDVPYDRQRDLEFASPGLPTPELLVRLEALRDFIPAIVSRLTLSELEAVYPENVVGLSLSAQQFLIHLLGHLSYHLGQIDYLRRFLTKGNAITFAGIEA